LGMPRRWKQICGVAVTLLILLGVPLVATGPATAASNGLWSVYPTTVPGQPDRVFVQPLLTPGKSYLDSVTIVNYTAAPLTFNLYGSDAFNTPGGGLSLRRRTDPQVDIGKWIKLPESRLTVGAHSQSVVPFAILPPMKATPGDHVGGIVAEQTQGTTAQEGAIPVTVIQAVAVRVYARVRGPLHPRLTERKTSLALSRPTSSEFGGSVSARVHFTVSNSGNVVLTPHATLSLVTPCGRAARRSFDVGQLLPGNTLSYSLAFHGLSPLGHLRAEVTVTASHAKATGWAAQWALPWGLIAIAALVVLTAIVLLLRGIGRRRRRRREGRYRHKRRKDAEPAVVNEPDLAPS
jgi:hypothetical protein